MGRNQKCTIFKRMEQSPEKRKTKIELALHCFLVGKISLFYGGRAQKLENGSKASVDLFGRIYSTNKENPYFIAGNTLHKTLKTSNDRYYPS